MAVTRCGWRHPRVPGAEGRCVGRTDLRLDPRKARRLARRIDALARRMDLPRVVITSPLARCADVGRVLADFGWVHRIDPALIEMNFGRWDGLPWTQIPRPQIDAWCADFAHYRPGGGETVAELLQRVARWCAGAPDDARVFVTHGGWLAAQRWLARHGDRLPTSEAWPTPPRCGECTDVSLRPDD